MRRLIIQGHDVAHHDLGAKCQRRSSNSTLEEDIVREDFPGGEN